MLTILVRGIRLLIIYLTFLLATVFPHQDIETWPTSHTWVLHAQPNTVSSDLQTFKLWILTGVLDDSLFSVYEQTGPSNNSPGRELVYKTGAYYSKDTFQTNSPSFLLSDNSAATTDTTDTKSFLIDIIFFNPASKPQNAIWRKCNPGGQGLYPL